MRVRLGPEARRRVRPPVARAVAERLDELLLAFAVLDGFSLLPLDRRLAERFRPCLPKILPVRLVGGEASIFVGLELEGCLSSTGPRGGRSLGAKLGLRS